MKQIHTLIFVLLLLVPLLPFAQEVQEEVEPTYYDKAKVIRVKYSQGEAYVKRSYDEGFEEASVNLPVFEGDLVGTTEGRLGLYLGRLNYLRLDFDSEIVLNEIPSLRKTNLNLKIIRGGVYLDIENIDYERDVEIQTPDCGVFLLSAGLYRINVSEAGGTEVISFSGAAEVAGSQSSRNLRENQKMVMRDGQIAERPYYFYDSEKDEFDRWNGTRNQALGYSRYGSSRYMDQGYEDYESELSRHGRWRYSSSYGSYIWLPYSISSSWRPYYHGRWIWNPYYGNVWHPFDSWGWYTHHYGRWHWDYSMGWHWMPGYRWSPAWVYWYGSSSYYGWCPLSRWNRPVIVVNKRWLRNYNYRRLGLPARSLSSVVIRKSHISASGIHRVALSGNSLKQVAKNSLKFRGASLRSKPKIERVSLINAKGKSMTFKKGGIVSNKYKATVQPGKLRSVKGNVLKYSGSKVTAKKVNKYSAKSNQRKRQLTLPKAYIPRTRTGGTVKKGKTSTYRSPKLPTRSRTVKKAPLPRKSSSGRSGSKTTIKKKKKEPAYASFGRPSGSTPVRSESPSSRAVKKNSHTYSGQSKANRSTVAKTSRYQSYGSSNRSTPKRSTNTARNQPQKRSTSRSATNYRTTPKRSASQPSSSRYTPRRSTSRSTYSASAPKRSTSRSGYTRSIPKRTTSRSTSASRSTPRRTTSRSTSASRSTPRRTTSRSTRVSRSTPKRSSSRSTSGSRRTTTRSIKKKK